MLRFLFTSILIVAGLSACVNTSSAPETTGLALPELAILLTEGSDVNAPLLVTGPASAVEAVWAEQNVIFTLTSPDGGTTFPNTPVELYNANPLGTLPIQGNFPLPFSMLLDADTEHHLLMQMGQPNSDPNQLARSDIFYSHVELFDTSHPVALVTGGRDQVGRARNAATAYDPRTQQWESVPHPSFTAALGCSALNSDGDLDGIKDFNDNCPFDANGPLKPLLAVPPFSPLDNQTDTDADGVGNACDLCPNTADRGQWDSDADGIGNACDNCPMVANPGQEDLGFFNGIQVGNPNNGVGDACDGANPNFDADGDGVNDNIDNCPINANGPLASVTFGDNQRDSNGDGIGNACQDPNLNIRRIGRWGHATTTVPGTLCSTGLPCERVYKTGGLDQGGVLDQVTYFDSSSGFWFEDAPLLGPRAGHALASADGFLYALGGNNGSTSLASIERFTPASTNTRYTVSALDVTACFVPASSEWVPLPAVLNQAREQAALVVIPAAQSGSGASEIHLIGGEQGAFLFRSNEAFRVQPGSGNLVPITTPLPDLPTPRSRHQAVLEGHTIYVFGGTRTGNDVLDSILTLDITAVTPTWEVLRNPFSGQQLFMPRPRKDHVAAVLDGGIYLIAGTEASSPDTSGLQPVPVGTPLPNVPDPGQLFPITQVDIYDPLTFSWRTAPESSYDNAGSFSALAVVNEPSQPRNLSRQGANATQGRMAIDAVSGDVYVVWRNEPRVTTGQFQTDTVSEVYLARSEDGGASFFPPKWLSGISILAERTTNYSRSPQVAVGPDHSIHLTWIETGDPTARGGGQELTYVACTPDSALPSGIDCPELGLRAFPTTETRPANDPSSGSLNHPTVTVDDDGVVYLAWVDQNGTMPLAERSANLTSEMDIYLSRRLPGSDFPPFPVTVTTNVNLRSELADIGQAARTQLAQGISQPQLIVKPGGDVVVIWTNKSEVRARRSRDGGQSFHDEVGLSTTVISLTSRLSPRMVSLDDSRILSLWQNITDSANDGTPGTTQVFTRPFDRLP